MSVIKCGFCKKTFREADHIIITDGKWRDAVHDECHYDYLANMHLNSPVTLDELKQEIKAND